jgi:hypothetical protein
VTCPLCGADRKETVLGPGGLCTNTISCNSRRAAVPIEAFPPGPPLFVSGEIISSDVIAPIPVCLPPFPRDGLSAVADDLPPTRELEIDFMLDSVQTDADEGLAPAAALVPKAAKWKNVKQTFIPYRDTAVFWSGWLAHPDKAGSRFGYWLAPEPNGHGSMMSVVGDDRVRATGRPIKPLPVGTTSEDAGRLRAEARIRLEGALDHAIAVGEKLGVR